MWISCGLLDMIRVVFRAMFRVFGFAALHIATDMQKAIHLGYEV